jgi:hypothetical protein
MSLRFDTAILSEMIYLTGDEAKVNISANTPNKFQFIGENKRRVLLLCRTNNGNMLPDSQLQTLEKMIHALQLSMQDVALVVVEDYKHTSFRDINKQFNPSVVLLFGLLPGDLHLHIHTPEYQPVIFQGITFLCSQSLDTLTDVHKKRLWTSLKEIFKIA